MTPDTTRGGSPDTADLRDPRPAEAARLVLRKTWAIPGARLPLPVDPVAIARKLEMEVYTAVLPEAFSGTLQKKVGQPARVYLNRDDAPVRQRFTCAHEVGHFIKRTPEENDHFDYVDRRDQRSATGMEAEEVYANQFAAELLMPADEVAEAVGLGLSLRAMAMRFDVSTTAMDLRLRNLRLS